MPLVSPSSPRTPAARRRLGITAQAGQLLGTTVTGVVPLQRHSPALMLVASLAEVATLVALVVTANLAALAALVALSLVMVVGLVTNTRQVIAFTDMGTVILSASLTGWPHGVVGPGPRHVDLPEPRGVGVALRLDATTWWVDRASFRLLEHARRVTAPAGDGAIGDGATGDESPELPS
jgi:hypothetical protein